ncbi:MAG TPA: hypothetical protein DCY48_04140 [Candidatus Magasanikbacteria bacterium]|nr:MAG: hypothetical protein A3I74_00305 [Candidatus Magasanikbacteria bacterium RIFCSPLOWO2_02_FULL_47_16]OGH80106.1 MAG: hypothetical protein A3C10_02925 [Candidatus Magasanikbacteria bacterium RIFCSPHIGHO2_02_FULL_48_18]OGH83185.1 MAG: hypothetical protein A3G08_02640 [Candidatus Magasanikbacteria bacterium RIFCSPLOWO2_12_FULL_47_9b]HAZ28935.1 hypothetical protein [Candidatus Magasanikbacteria bacterium]
MNFIANNIDWIFPLLCMALFFGGFFWSKTLWLRRPGKPRAKPGTTWSVVANLSPSYLLVVRPYGGDDASCQLWQLPRSSVSLLSYPVGTKFVAQKGGRFAKLETEKEEPSSNDRKVRSI